MEQKMNTELSRLPNNAREYCMHKLVIENRSSKTVLNYACDLRVFFRYMLAIKTNCGIDINDPEKMSEIDVSGLSLDFIKSISTMDIYQFLMHMQDLRDNQWAARARKLSAIRGFFKYMTVKMHLLEDNPARDIEAPKARKLLPKFLTFDETVIFLNTVAENSASKSFVRDYTIITLFLNCGMRLSELVGINLSDINSDLSNLRVVGKGSKERIIYLNSACREVLSQYLTYRLAQKDIKDREALFLSNRGNRISNRTVQYMVDNYLKLAGFANRHLSVHKLRHTAATLMYQTGKVDVRVLKDILGHEQLNTTQIYTHISDESMKAAMEENPISSLKNGIK